MHGLVPSRLIIGAGRPQDVQTEVWAVVPSELAVADLAADVCVGHVLDQSVESSVKPSWCWWVRVDQCIASAAGEMSA